MTKKPPISKYCTLKQACEYIAFGWEPRTNSNEQLCDRMEYVRSTNYAFLTHGDAFGSPIIPPDDKYDEDNKVNNHYNREMTKALGVLYGLIKSGAIAATGIADPAWPDWTEYLTTMNKNIHKHKNYDPKKYKKRTTVILPEEWELDVIYNWIVAVPTQSYYQTSYRDVKINFAELEAVCRSHKYTVTLETDGHLCVTNGETTTVIYKMNTTGKNYQWLKFYITHPNQKITKQDVIDEFKCTSYAYAYWERISQCVFATFKEHKDLMHQFFPIVNTKEILCTPTFMRW